MEEAISQEAARQKLIAQLFSTTITELNVDQSLNYKIYVVSYDKEDEKPVKKLRKIFLKDLQLFFGEENIKSTILMEPGVSRMHYMKQIKDSDYIIVLASKGLKEIYEHDKAGQTNADLKSVSNLLTNNKSKIITFYLEATDEECVPFFMEDIGSLPMRTDSEYYDQFFALLKIIINSKQQATNEAKYLSRDIIKKHEKLFKKAIKGLSEDRITEYQHELLAKKEKSEQESQAWMMKILGSADSQEPKTVPRNESAQPTEPKHSLEDSTKVIPEQVATRQKEMTEILLASQFQQGRQLLADIMAGIREEDIPLAIKEQIETLDDQCKDWQPERESIALTR